MHRVVADKVLVADLTHSALAGLGVTVPGLTAAGAALTSHDAEAWEAVRITIDTHPGVVALRLSKPPGPLDDLAVVSAPCTLALSASSASETFSTMFRRLIGTPCRRARRRCRATE